MKIERTNRRLAWASVITALGAVLLIAVVGCINITIKVVTPQGTPPQATPPQGTRLLEILGDGGGNFVPVQSTPVSQTETTICGKPVSGTKVIFSFTTNGTTLLWQTNSPGATGFRGTVVDLDNSSQAIANTDYYLQLFATATKKGCCTNVLGSGTEVGTNIWAGTFGYRFTAFFKTGHVPPSGHQLQLQGVWTQ